MKRLEGIKGAIFDLDGTLIDSMWIWQEINTEFFSTRGGVMPENFEKEVGHMGFKKCAEYVKQKYNLRGTEEEYVADWNARAREYYANIIEAKTCAKEFLQNLKDNGVKIALATATNRDLSDLVLKRLGLFDYFDVFLNTQQLETDKSVPKIYDEAVKALGVEKENCVVFEDILLACQTLKKAGYKTVAIEDANSEIHRKEITELADISVRNYGDFM